MKPCPFCGSSEIQHDGIHGDDEDHRPTVASVCCGCHACGPFVLVSDETIDNSEVSENVWDERT